MSFDLISKHGHFRFNNAGWREVLRLAHECGWEPAGTVHPATDWRGGYNSNDYQEVTADDARALADAVDKATQSPLIEPGWADYLREFIGFARQSDGFCLG